MKTSYFSFLLLPIVLALSSSSVLAKDRQRGDRHEKMMKELKLTDQQKTQLKESRSKNRAEMKTLREKIKATRQKLHDQMKSDASDGDLKNTHSELQKLRSQMDELRFQKILEVREVLTPEQRTKFKELHERKGRHHKMWDQDEELE